jgi:hypothetical protein
MSACDQKGWAPSLELTVGEALEPTPTIPLCKMKVDSTICSSLKTIGGSIF